MSQKEEAEQLISALTYMQHDLQDSRLSVQDSIDRMLHRLKKLYPGKDLPEAHDIKDLIQNYVEDVERQQGTK
jgi:hypothetical protein